MYQRYMNALRSALFIVIIVATLMFGYLIVSSNEISWDVSRAGGNSLDLRTKNIARHMDFDVHITVFDTPGKEQNGARALLDLYKQESNRITFGFIDLDANPELARRFGINHYGQAVLSGKGRQVISDATTEHGITNALLELKQDRQKNIYVLSGHGEADVSDEGRGGLSLLTDALQQEGFGVKELNFSERDGIPQDADLLVIPGPRVALLPAELDMLQRFMENGGNALIAIEPGSDGGLRRFLRSFGIGLDDSLIRDPSGRLLGGDDTALVIHSYGRLKGIADLNYTTVFPTSRPLNIEAQLPSHIRVSWLARTSDQSRAGGETLPAPEQKTASGSPAGLKGPFNIAVSARKTISEHAIAGIMVFGDADFITNAYFNLSGNRILAMSCINILLDEDPLIAVQVGRTSDKPFVLTPAQTTVVFLVTVFIIPSLFFILGLFRYRRRYGT